MLPMKSLGSGFTRHSAVWSRRNDDAGAEDVHGVFPEDAGGHEVHYELALLVYDGVSGVVAALIADHHVVALAEQVYHAALALVAPVRADNSC